MNQASMFFTAVVMLAGAGWYMMASNPELLAKPAVAEAKVADKTQGPKRAPLVARAPLSAQAPSAVKAWPEE